VAVVESRIGAFIWSLFELVQYNNNNNNNKHSIDSLQKTAILGTAHIIRKALQCEA
jgi:hypothetical protein